LFKFENNSVDIRIDLQLYLCDSDR
jgi:hypothetical protein